MSLHEPLDAIESRIFGVLVEKAFTTPDGYPFSLNGLVTGSNQKSNRDPALSLTEQTVSEGLVRLRLHHLVHEVRTSGARVEKYAHDGQARLEVDDPTLAVLAELLLRGPQTAGQLRGRAARMVPIPTLPDLDAVLRPLMERGMVTTVPPEPGSRAVRYAQLLSPGLHPVEGATPVSDAPSPAASPGTTATPPSTASAATPNGTRGSSASAADAVTDDPSRGPPTTSVPSDDVDAHRRLAELEGEVTRLRERVAQLERRLDRQPESSA